MTLTVDLCSLLHCSASFACRYTSLLPATVSIIVPSLGKLPKFFPLSIALGANPHTLVVQRDSASGAGVANQKAAFLTVMSAFGEAELPEAAHALHGCAVWYQGDGEGGAQLTTAIQQQLGLAAFEMLQPGFLVLDGGGGHVEGLSRRADQPLVLYINAVLDVFHLDVL